MTAMANLTSTGKAPRRRRAATLGQGGFTYVGLIILVMVIGLVGAATLKIDALMQRAAAEEELLAAGAAFSDALRSYAAATPPGQPPQPPTLRELLRDPRSPALVRHLRKLFVDPMTGSTEWGVIYQGDKTGVIGVYSLSQAKPLKVGNFDARFVNFDNKLHISDWKFTASGQGVLAPPSRTPAPANPPMAVPEPPAMPGPVDAEPPAAPVEPPAEEEPEEKPVVPVAEVGEVK
jgi:type II secretory pathway pseudopilin PulG